LSDPRYYNTEIDESEGIPELAASKYLGGDMGIYWLVSIFVLIVAFMLFRKSRRNKKTVTVGEFSLI